MACCAALASEGLSEEIFFTSSDMYSVDPTEEAILFANPRTALLQAAGSSGPDCANASDTNGEATIRTARSTARSGGVIRQRGRIGLSRVKIASISVHDSTPAKIEMAQRCCVFTRRKPFVSVSTSPIAEFAAGWVALPAWLPTADSGWSKPPAGGFAGVTPIANFPMAPSPRHREAS